MVSLNIHIVQSGDTLWAISQRYRTNMNQIITANGIDNPNMLVIGQALVIPSQPITYVVQRGDSLSAIASRFNVSIQSLITENDIVDPAKIFIGQILTIPLYTHTIQAGDTLWRIAQQYGTTVEAIVQVNRITNPNTLSIGQVIRIPERVKQIKEVNAYITGVDQNAQNEIRSLGKYFTYLSPFTHAIKEDGTISPMYEASLLSVAKEKRVAPLLVLTNFSGRKFSSDLAATILRNPTLQEKAITNILKTMKDKGYRGLNIDFEYVYPQDRENYNAFLRRVVARLRPERYSVSTAVAPKIATDQKGILYEAHDYRAHGEIVDFVVIMTYEWGWAGGPPWAIAPVDAVKRVLNYAITEIPRQKIMMGVPLYGRDWKIPWVEGTYARTVTPLQAVRLAAQYGVPIQYNKTYEAPFFRYTDQTGQRHEVWFEDARSQQAKFDLVKQYGLRGFSYWVLGNPFPQNWLVQDWNFKARKIM